ncbi:MAG: ThiF family adenylyltransferase [Tepidisphaeraceae bacterium]|jgi:sulfur carrier protein ThiS adenylyltransferase
MNTAMVETPDLSQRDVRQRDLVPPQKLAECHALVIGVGAVGRQAALQLAATGISRMTLVDDDHVATENLAPQGYFPDDLGRNKVEATAQMCRKLNPDMAIHLYPERFRRSSPKSLSCFNDADCKLVVFCCVDSITTRGIIWEAVKPFAAFFVDARMAAEIVRVLASDRPMDDVYYPTTLFESAEAYSGSCTAKSTIYCASIAAGLMLAQFTRWLRGLPVDRDLLVNLLAAEMTVA